ncbi:uncharacterized protein LOC132725644 [Ruditapes philippinarum]|uniref:uncharacterized protein LOC132725644 n=1 Tax=Ruditapes philippinarum TaxID=129788 RepID=UPI00295AED1D|nr:uncharacterized protein LOC132725644 [Ruditapes philippinarum]
MVFATRNNIICAALFILAICFGRFFCCWNQEEKNLLLDLVSVAGIMVGLILLDIYRLKPEPSYTFKTLILHYAFLKITQILGFIMLKRFNKLCKNSKDHQEKVLKQILTQNKDTLFSKDHGLENVTSVESFREKMPLTTYDEYRKYAEMIREDGAEDVLFPGKAFFIALTSGTTSGKSKAFPKNPKAKWKVAPWLLIMHYKMIFATGNNFLSKWLYVKVIPKVITTKSGLESGPISAVTYKINFPFSVIPSALVHTEYESLYIHLAFSLIEDNVLCFSTMVSSTALSMFSILERDWETLCNDVENGTLSEHLNIPISERTRLNSLMKARPKRAALLRKEFAKGFQDIVSRIWPACPCLLALKTGVFETAANIVQEKYLGKLPIVSLVHIGTETFYGANINPMAEPDVRYVPLLPVNFFEFLPAEEYGEKTPSTVLAHQVEVGKMYEIVITTFDGLCRYRTEDVVKITGFHQTTPMYKFMYRAGDILSANLEKVPEFLLHDAVYAAATTWNKGFVEFTSCESVHVQLASQTSSDSFEQPKYVVFIEMNAAQRFRTNKKLTGRDIELAQDIAVMQPCAKIAN